MIAFATLRTALPLLPPSASGFPCIVAGDCNDRAAAHPHPQLELVTKNEGDHCRVFRPISTQPPYGSSESGEPGKRKRSFGPVGGGLPTISSGFRCWSAAKTDAKRRSKRRLARRNVRASPRFPRPRPRPSRPPRWCGGRAWTSGRRGWGNGFWPTAARLGAGFHDRTRVTPSRRPCRACSGTVGW